MKRFAIKIGVLLVVLPAFAQSQPAKAVANQSTMGVLIGWNPAPDSGASPEAGEQSRQDPELTITSVTTLSDGSKISHQNQTVRADPLFTLWIFVSGGKVETRPLQHIVVPRKDGFWLLGTNTDYANADSSRAQTDFFWASPLGQEPKLAADPSVDCMETTAARELTYVGPEYFSFSEFWTATCAHYDEGHRYLVIPLEAAADTDVEGQAPPASSLIKLLGPQAQQQFQRLSHEAQGWENECGMNGFAGSPTNWTLRHRQGRWQVVVKFVGSGGGICSRYDEDRVFDPPLPRSLVSSNVPLPLPWASIKRAFPKADDAVVSPDGKLMVVFSPSQRAAAMVEVVVAAIDRDKLLKLSAPTSIAAGRPVLMEWAVGANATRWDRIFATLPPNPKAIQHDEPALH